MDVERVVSRIVKTMTARDAEGKHFGVIVLAEGLAELLPMKYLKGIPRDEHGHISISHVNLGRMFAKLVSDEYKQQTGKSRKVTGLQLGYESRCARPQAFDVMLGSQLGVGAYRALVEEGLNGVMVSVVGQLQLHFVPFEKLIDPANARHRRPLHRAQQRLPPPGAVLGDVRERVMSLVIGHLSLANTQQMTSDK